MMRFGQERAALANRVSDATQAPDGKSHRRRRNPPQLTELRHAADRSPQVRFPASSSRFAGAVLSWPTRPTKVTE